MSSSSLVEVMRPRGGLVVAAAGLEAAVQDADKAVGQLTQGGVVLAASGALVVVVGPGAGGDTQRRECLGHQGIDEPVVVHEPGGDDLLAARGPGDRAGCGVVLAGL